MSWMEQPIFFIDFEGSIASGDPRVRRRHPPWGPRDGGQDPALRADGQGPLRGYGDPWASKGGAFPACEPFSADWELFAGLRETGPLAAQLCGRRELAPEGRMALPAQLA